jgi:DNA-binding GntR family transcriptional regulator
MPPRKLSVVTGGAAARGERADTKAAMHAAEVIRLKILEGLLSPGQRLIEPDLMSELGVGRSTIREAFLRLDAEGYVELRHQRGAIVKRLTRRDMAELFEVREQLEGLAASLSAARSRETGNRDWLLEQRVRWSDDELRNNALRHMDENVVLHRGIVEMSGNRRLARTLEPMQVPGYRMQYLQLMDGARQAQSSKDHLEIIDAILSGDAARAGRLMRAHVREAGLLAQRIPNLLD